MAVPRSILKPRKAAVLNASELPDPTTLRPGDTILAANGTEYEITDPTNNGNPALFVWVARPSAGTPGAPIGAGEVVFGASTGALTSSPRLTFTSSTNTLRVHDGTQLVAEVNGNRVDTGFGGRGFYVYGFSGGIFLEVAVQDPAAPPNRIINVYNSNDLAFFTVNGTVASQAISYASATGVPLFVYEGASPRSTFQDVNTDLLLELRHEVAVGEQGVYLGVPLTFASFTVAALPTPPNGGSGSVAWASNGRMGAEGVGAGTGVLVEYKAAGPAGAGYYVVGTSALVTS